MVRVIFGTDLPSQGPVEVHALTLGATLDALARDQEWIHERGVRVFVDGVDAERLEGEHTPVGPEDTLLLTRRPSSG